MCSTRQRWRHGGSSGGKLLVVRGKDLNEGMEPAHSKVISSLTQGLLLEEQEDSVQQLEVLGKVVQLDPC